ncbi:MAG: GAF domain-containing protein [Chloroflexi bacterium]|nr:ATP-binding protein [Anaerolineaceae bacterium]NMB89190.1 GAF domain-containing protein [Chloroflexota bacterium]
MNNLKPPPDIVKLEHLYAISHIVAQSAEWKPALEQIAQVVRSIFIVDNLAVYLVTNDQENLEIMYAKALGRGRRAEADIAWGEIIANKVASSRQIHLEQPTAGNTEPDRLKQPHLLGIPLMVNRRFLGSMIFIRFGGPFFTPENIKLAEFIANQIASLVERKNLQSSYTLLEQQHQQAQLQQDFISTITHELRNPLGFIKGYTTTLLREDTTWDQVTQQEFLHIIDQETDHLQELIDNLLDSARLQSGQLEMRLQPVRPDGLINDVITWARLHHPNMAVHLKVEGNLLPVRADPRRIAQVFENILSNADKYAPGSDVLITVRQNDRGTYIAIQDFGPGITEQNLPFIFNRFYRNPEQPPGIRGSGLGLYICKQIIQAHKGQIAATSTIGQGTTFEIFLPAHVQVPDQ